MKKFVDRKKELDTLEKEYTRSDASFVVIYGRRRVGKTTLINKFCENKKHVIRFLASEENENENRNTFKNIVSESLNNTLLKDANIDRWEPIFNLISESAKEERIIIVMDEFQYLGKSNAAFPSIMMNIWDNILKNNNIMLILCGSLISMMTKQVLSYNSPLYGRRTAQIKLKQISFKDYKEFFPKLSEDNLIQRYAITGGVPKYIELFSKQGDIYDMILESIMSRNSFLYAEPEFLLKNEVSEIGSYFSVLKAIASGNHKLGKIATVLNIPQTNLTKYLATLSDLDIIERQVPITEENESKSKKGLYFIKDNFLNFWFQFIFPYKGMLEADQDDYVLCKIKNNLIDNHISYVYEDICREKVWELNKKGLTFNRVGRWWGNKNIEIDIVAYDSFGTDILFGECKYSKNPKGMDVLLSLMEKADYVPWNKNNRKEYYVLFSRSGYSDELKNYALKKDNIFLL